MEMGQHADKRKRIAARANSVYSSFVIYGQH